MDSIKDLEELYELDLYPKRDVSLVRGDKCKLYSDSGEEYIDCVAGHGVCNLGHSNLRIMEAINNLDLISCPETLPNPVRAELLRRLVSVTPIGLDKVFLCNSGTEAVEAAIKFARFTTGKTKIVGAVRGFHGRTFGSLSATWRKEIKEDFEPLLDGFFHVPFNNFEKLKEIVDDETAAVILELIQGEGGVRLADKDYVAKVRDLCDSLGVLLIIDEVQTGFGRTGKMFACEHYDLRPDIICLAKGIANGVPMGAVACNNKIKVKKLMHSSTFGGNILACSVSLATISELERVIPLMEGDYFLEKLRSLESDKIREVRGIGLMLAAELKVNCTPYLKALMDENVLALVAGKNVIRFLPPLIISKEEIDVVVSKLSKILN